MKKVYFVRHGESQGNLEKRYALADDPLTPHGQRQASFIAERIAKLSAEVIIASPFLRTKETAENIQKRIQKPLIFSDLFVEFQYPPEFAGKAVDDSEVHRIYRLIYDHADEDGWRYSHEETFSELAERARTALAFLAAREESEILVVSHGHFLRTLFAAMLFGERLTGRELLGVLHFLRTNNTGLTVCHYLEEGEGPPSEPWKAGPSGTWLLVAWNDHAHLG